MSIDSWLTTIGLLIAIIAFFPKPELKLLRLKLNPVELWVGLVILMIVLPFLIYFYVLAARFSFLNVFTIKNGILPKNAAFLFLYGLIVWLTTRFAWLRPNKKFNQEILEYYLELIKEVPFDVFFNIFRRYENIGSIRKVWPQFRELFTQPSFLNGIIHYQPEFMYRNWGCVDRQDDFDQLLDLFINDHASPYYKGIEGHWNSSTLIQYVSPLLDWLIDRHLRQSMEFEVIKHISKAGVSHLHREGFSSISVYMQTPVFLDHASEGLQLPMFFHIQFIGLLYATTIDKGVDIESYGGKNMYTIYSAWISKIIENLKLSGRKFTEKDNSNYHWLISKMLDNAGDWLRFFSENETFDDKFCSYLEFIPGCLSLCFSEVYKGYKEELIPLNFVVQHLHHNVLSVYYHLHAKSGLKERIEKQVISKIPQSIVIAVFNFSVGEEFAVIFDDFDRSHFHSLLDEDEMAVVSRLRGLLRDNNQLI